MKLHYLLNDPDAVFVARFPVAETPTWPEFDRIARQALALIQLELAGENVVLKPNVTSGEHFANPELGVDTHPAFVGGMVAYLREHGARPGGIFVVEDPRDSDDNNPRHWQGTGYLEIAEATGVKLRCPTTYTCVRRTVPHPLVHKTRNVSRPAVAPGTVLINVPKFKTHNLAITTLGMKNLMGLDLVFDRHYCAQAWQDMPAEIKAETRPREEWMDRATHELWQAGLAKRLADLAQVVRPHLNVVEGVVGRDGTGFRRGTNYPLGLVVAGTNIVAVDAMSSYLMGFEPTDLIYLKVAAGIGLGQNDVARLRVYTPGERGLALCQNTPALRLQPKLTVISGIQGENAGDVS